MAKRTVGYNIMFTDQEHAAFVALAKARDLPQSTVLRQALAAAIQMQRGCPTCANGNPCYVPQMHAHAAAPPAPTPNLSLIPGGGIHG